MLSRRSFFIGLAAAGAASQIPAKVAWGTPAAAINEPSKLWVAKGFDWAALHEVTFSSMASPDEHNHEPVVYKLFRYDDEAVALLAWQLHPLATMRWVAMDDAAVSITKEHPLRFDVEPCHTNTVITLVYNIERNRDQRKKFFSEVFHYRGEKEVTHELHAINYEDEHLIKGARA